MVVGDLGEGDLFVTFPALLIILVLVLAQLTAAIGAKTVKMATVRQGHRVGLTAGYRHDLLVAQGLHARRVGLIWLVLCILRQISNVVQTELS